MNITWDTSFTSQMNMFLDTFDVMVLLDHWRLMCINLNDWNQEFKVDKKNLNTEGVYIAETVSYCLCCLFIGLRTGETYQDLLIVFYSHSTVAYFCRQSDLCREWNRNDHSTQIISTLRLRRHWCIFVSFWRIFTSHLFLLDALKNFWPYCLALLKLKWTSG